MYRQNACRWLILGLAAAALTGPGAFGQQKYHLRDPDTPGDLSVVDTTMDLNVNLNVHGPTSDQNLDQLTFSQRNREQYTEEVLAVDSKGVTGLRRTYTVARSVSIDPSLRESRKVSSLQGKTVTIRRHGTRVEVVPNRGQLTAEDRNSLMPALDRNNMDYLPDHEVAPGDEWTLDPKQMAGVFGGMQKAEVKCRFQDVVPFAGHSCARIHMTVEASGPSTGTMGPMTMKLAGDVYHAIDLRRTLAAEFSGPITVQTQKTENGASVTVTGAGTMRIKETRRWLKARGRRLAARG